MNQPHQHVHPVVVVGAGLAGCAAAAFLQHAGVPTVVVERHDRPTARPRAWVISARSQELLRELGLADTVAALGTPGSWYLETVGSLRDARTTGPDDTRDDTVEVSPTGAAMCDQDVLEGILREHAISRGAQFRWGETVTDIIERDDVVEVHRGDRPPLNARHVIVAEGARAGLLERLGITSTHPAGEDFAEFDQVLFRSAALDQLMADRPCRAFFLPQTMTSVFRRDLDRWQVHRQGSRVGDTDDDVVAAIVAAIGQRVEDIDLLDHTQWRPTARLADTFRAGHVFLVGDAAHAMPPSLGMAGNLAIADAHNLAWKLAWVRSGRAGAGLLDSYEKERRPIGALVLDQSLRRIRQQESLELATVQLGLGYPPGPSSALVGDGADPVIVTDLREFRPVVGARLPHRRLPDGRSTLDLADARTFVAIGAGQATASIPVHQVPECAADPELVWIVRPDGHVAAHVPPADIDTVLDTILDRRDDARAVSSGQLR